MILHSVYSSDTCKLFHYFYIIILSTTGHLFMRVLSKETCLFQNSVLVSAATALFYGDIGDLIKTHRRSRRMRLVISLTELLHVLSICAQKGR